MARAQWCPDGGKRAYSTKKAANRKIAKWAYLGVQMHAVRHGGHYHIKTELPVSMPAVLVAA
jgi:hypothetical protein